MKGHVGLYSPQRAKEISDAVNQLLQFEQNETENLQHDPERWYFVKAKEDIPAASNPETGYTTGKVTPLRYTDDDDKDMELFPISVDSELELTNRTTSDIAEDDYFWCRQIEAELVPFIGGSGGGSRTLFFRIREVDCYTGDWWVEPTFISSCGLIPDTREDGLVRVIQSCCKSPFTDEELVLSGYGTAAYVYPIDSCGINGQWREVVHCADDGCDAEDGHEECEN